MRVVQRQVLYRLYAELAERDEGGSKGRRWTAKSPRHSSETTAVPQRYTKWSGKTARYTDHRLQYPKKRLACEPVNNRYVYFIFFMHFIYLTATFAERLLF